MMSFMNIPQASFINYEEKDKLHIVEKDWKIKGLPGVDFINTFCTVQDYLRSMLKKASQQ